MFTALVLTVGTVFLVYLLKRSKRPRPGSDLKSHAPNVPYSERNFIHYTDLLDPNIRADPHKFNDHIQRNVISKSDTKSIRNGIIPVRGEKNTFLICKYRAIKSMLSNEKVFSSNPFADERLIAPNAMDDHQHKVIMKYLKKFYSPSTVSRQIPVIQQIIKQLVDDFISDQKESADAMDGLCQLIVMKTALFMLGLPPQKYQDSKTIEDLIHFNNVMVQLIAPIGGIGHKIDFSFYRLCRVLCGLVMALVPTLRLIVTIGISNSWNLLRPDLNILRVPNRNRDDGTPRIQIWICPELLVKAPAYFLYLNALYESHGMDRVSGGERMCAHRWRSQFEI